MLLPDVANSSEERVILHNVRWETYEQLLSNYIDGSSPRFAYDQGELEISRPSSEHEELSAVITQLVYILAEEWGFEYRNFGRTTFKHREMESGFEPDSCFYIQSVEQISGVRRLDPAIHPPPDLVIEIEIDMTHPSLKKFPIYARMNVPEVWRYDGKKVAIFRLENGEYVESESSIAVPRLSSSELSALIGKSNTIKRSVCIKTVREWAKLN